MKKGFLLFSVLFLVIIFSFLSIQLIQNKSFSHQIDTLKRLDFEATKIEDSIKNYYVTHNSLEEYHQNDERFVVNITVQEMHYCIEIISSYHQVRRYFEIQKD